MKCKVVCNSFVLVLVSFFCHAQLTSGTVGILDGGNVYSYRWEPSLSTPSLGGNPTYYSGFTGVTSSSGRKIILCNHSVTSSSTHTLLYWEVIVLSTTTNPNIGFATPLIDVSGSTFSLGQDIYGYGYLTIGASSYSAHNNAFPAYGATIAALDTVQCILDMTNGYAYFGKNGILQNSATVANILAGIGVNAAFSGLSSLTISPAVGEYGGNALNYIGNWGQQTFSTNGRTLFTSLTGFFPYSIN